MKDRKETLVTILRQSLPKYLNLTFSDVMPRVSSCVAITETLDFSSDGGELSVQLELNPLYVHCVSDEKEVVSDFLINDGKMTFSCTIMLPRKICGISWRWDL